MANLNVLDATETSKYLKGTGEGTNLDPFIPEHKETSAAAILAAVDGIEALLTTMDADTSALAAAAGTVAVTSGTVTVGNATLAVTQSGTWNIGSISTLPNVTVAAGTVAATQSGTWNIGSVSTMPTVTVTGAVAATQSGTWNIGAVTTLPNVVVGSGTVVATGPLTDTQLRLTPVPVSGTVSTTVDSVTVTAGTVVATGPLTDTQLRLTPVPISGTVSTTIDSVTVTAGTVVATVADATIASGTIAATQSGTWNVGTVTALPNVVVGSGTVTATVANATIASGTVLATAPDIVVTVTPTLGTAAYTAADLLFDSTEIANATRGVSSAALLHSLVIIDKDDQKAAMTVLIADAATDFGNVNDAPNADDTEVATVAGWVAVSATDYKDLGGASVATISNIGLEVQSGTATSSLYLAGITAGTPTHTESGLVFKLGFMRS